MSLPLASRELTLPILRRMVKVEYVNQAVDDLVNGDMTMATGPPHNDDVTKLGPRGNALAA